MSQVAKAAKFLGPLLISWILFFVLGETLARAVKQPDDPTIKPSGIAWWIDEAGILVIIGNIDNTIRTCWIGVMFPKLYGAEKANMTVWWLLLSLYFRRSFVSRERVDHVFHVFNMFFVGFIATFLGMRHRGHICKLVIRYWFMVVFICGILAVPGLKRSLEEDPINDYWIRLRVGLIETIFVICWLTGGDQMVDHKIFTEDKLQWVSYWSLLVYCSHVALFMVLPNQLWAGWLVLIMEAIPCILFTRRRSMEERPPVVAQPSEQ